MSGPMAQHQAVGGEQQAAEAGDRADTGVQAGPGGAPGDLLESGGSDAGLVALGRAQHA